MSRIQFEPMYDILNTNLGKNSRNSAFDVLKNTRHNENSTKPQQNLKVARCETDKTYRAIVKRIDALIEVNGETAYTGFVTDLNQRIENYNQVLAVRQGRNTKKDNPDTES